MTRTEMKFVGYGGQGIITMSKLIAKGALLYDGKEVAQTEAYGAAARGGVCWAEVIISDKKIDYPRAMSIQYLIVLTKMGADAYKGKVTKDGIIFRDPLTVPKYRAKKTQKLYDIPATQIAREEFKFPVVANVIMFGAIVAITKLISRESAKKTVESSVPKKALEINYKALERGFQIADELLAQEQSS
ncbi:MAG: 2-oxoacid:acceptor oxidoreductase family protein [Candidatus Helarchaeota archaeon]|nr:2-oxoacid:acceptor oxidoreductase family protein [Candidatus Helarchaeota archaeon]